MRDVIVALVILTVYGAALGLGVYLKRKGA
jgi:hypothetical protein